MTVVFWDETLAVLLTQITNLEERAQRLRVKAVYFERAGDTTRADGCDVFADAAIGEASQLRDRLAEIEEDTALKEGASDRAYGRAGW